MKQGGGKSKGGNFEREIARYLTKWLTGQDKEYYFYRSPSSGAVSTVSACNGEISGDIISVKPEGRVLTDLFSIELKTGYDDVDLLKMFKSNKNNTFDDFWVQCIRDSRRANRYGMLIFRKKGYPTIMGTEIDVIKSLKKQKVNLPKSITIDYIDSDLPNMVIFSLIDFFESVSPFNMKKVK